MSKDTFAIPADAKTYTFKIGTAIQHLMIAELFGELKKRGICTPDQIMAVPPELLTLTQDHAISCEKEK